MNYTGTPKKKAKPTTSTNTNSRKSRSRSVSQDSWSQSQPSSNPSASQDNPSQSFKRKPANGKDGSDYTRRARPSSNSNSYDRGFNNSEGNGSSSRSAEQRPSRNDGPRSEWRTRPQFESNGSGSNNFKAKRNRDSGYNNGSEGNGRSNTSFNRRPPRKFENGGGDVWDSNNGSSENRSPQRSESGRTNNNEFSPRRGNSERRDFQPSERRDFQPSERSSSRDSERSFSRDSESRRPRGRKRPSSNPSRGGGGGGRGRVSSEKLKYEQFNMKVLVSDKETAHQVEQKPSIPFNDMPLSPQVKKILEERGFEYPTLIQEASIPHLMNKENLVGIADTGTGKTGAFLLPIIESCLGEDKSYRALVIVPTRELAIQVHEELKKFAKGLDIAAANFIGGLSIEHDLKALRRKRQVIIATPGRLLDLVKRRVIGLNTFKTLVLDEFDRMLDMGFIQPIRQISAGMTNRDQTILFSATEDKTQSKLIDSLVDNPVHVKCGGNSSNRAQINQQIVEVPRGANKANMLIDLVSSDSFEKVLIFAETKHQTDRIHRDLMDSGVRTDLIHGGKSQNYRSNALNKFRKGAIRILVATDVASRGIDVENITHVINYSIPRDYNSYVHRIGRTGRAGKYGEVYTFISA